MAPSVGIYIDGLINRHNPPDTQTALRITIQWLCFQRHQTPALAALSGRILLP